jgi:hypothetical protein
MNAQKLLGLGLQKMIVIYFKLIHHQSKFAECVVLFPICILQQQAFAPVQFQLWHFLMSYLNGLAG